MSITTATTATRPTQPPPLAALLHGNRKWSHAIKRIDPTYFERQAKGQAPAVLWIGCADSRVPETVICGADPGDIFVERNIANQFQLDDNNAISVLTYAVDHLGVEHVIVVGHSECGGAAACFKASQSPEYDPDIPFATIPELDPLDPINVWLNPLTNLAASLDMSTTPAEEAIPIVVDENVKQQVEHLSKTPVIVNAWARKSLAGKNVYIHGWVYEIGTGHLRDLGISRGPYKHSEDIQDPKYY